MQLGIFICDYDTLTSRFIFAKDLWGHGPALFVSIRLLMSGLPKEKIRTRLEKHSATRPGIVN
jgi:hypothetical protein